MATTRKKRAATIHKDILEIQEKLLEKEAEFEEAKREKYAVLGKYFADAFFCCVEFDFINMTNADMHKFVRQVKDDYDSLQYDRKMQAYDDLTDELLEAEAADERSCFALE